MMKSLSSLSAKEINRKPRNWSWADWFLHRVEIGMANDCWEWTGWKPTQCYGALMVKGKIIRAHRFSYELFVGPIPRGMFVCHHCDNPPCVNPIHLFLGTPMDNANDCTSKGRRVFGERNSRAKLTEDMVREIRASKVPSRLAAKMYGVTQTVICDVRRRETWKHVE